MRPVVTPAEMAAIDAAAPEPVEELIERAGAAVAREAVDLMGGTYGRRVLVLAGKGNNGADGRSAARRLEARGARVEVRGTDRLPDALPAVDLVIDAAFGTGFRGTWDPPRLAAGQTVLAVDVPSGVDGLTGRAAGTPWPARRTITFAALKPGLLLADGPERAGEVVVADIGLDVSSATIAEVEAADVAAWIPDRARQAHKWQAACWVIAGSPGMTGAAGLAAAGAQRAGAGYVRLSSPGQPTLASAPVEVVEVPLAATGWAEAVLADVARVAALAIGPGLGRAPDTQEQVRRIVAASHRPPLVVDGDGLAALEDGPALTPSEAPTVVTPHDGELARLGGDPGAPDRIGELRRLARDRGWVVLGKGAPTVVAAPDGRVLVVTSGDQRLATAGTGDVLTGAIAALLAQGAAPFEAAAAAAHLHGRAGALAWRRGLVAGDVAAHLPAALAEIPGG